MTSIAWFAAASVVLASPCAFANGGYPLVQQQAYIKASNASKVFGSALAMSGNTLVVGAWGEFSNATGVDGNQLDTSAPSAGAVYVFVRSAGTWAQQAYLKASNTEADDRFGYSVAIDGDTIVVGAVGEDSASPGVNGNEGDNSVLSAGAAYVFVRSGTTWSQQAYLKASNPGGDEFGTSVAIDGDTVVVGADAESSAATGIDGNQASEAAPGSGAAYVFQRSGTTWAQQAYVKASNTGTSDRFGQSVSIDGDTMAIGAPGEDSAAGIGGNQASNALVDSGAAYVFVRSGSTWIQEAYVKASNRGRGDLFGASVSISGDTLLTGAPFEDGSDELFNGVESFDNFLQAGAAYVFVRSGTTWSQQGYLKAAVTTSSDSFAASLDLDGDVAVIGAMDEDGASPGVNGDASNQTMGNAGAAAIYRRTGATWSHEAYLKASNPGPQDRFGRAVAVANGVVVVGAGAEASNATGIDGDQSNNSALNAGAAYAFTYKAEPYESFCFGDGTQSTPCPCTLPDTVPSPPAAIGHGCANSFDARGALLSASGTVSPDTLKIRVQVAPPDYMGFGLLLKGNGIDTSGVVSGDGLRCVDGALIRFGGHNAGTSGAYGGYWSYPNAVQTTPISVATVQAPGQSAYYQLFYRNSAPSFCTPATTNWSSGLTVDWP